MTITLNELQDLTVPVAEDFNFNFRALKTGVETVEALALTMIPMVSGAVVQYAGATAPSGWLLCDGTAVSRATYAALFAVVGTTYGVGDGSSTFNLPNLKGRVAVGYDAAQTEFDALGETGGAKTHTLTAAEAPAHVHGVTDPGHIHGAGKTVGVATPGSGSSILAASSEVEGYATLAAATGVSIQSAGGGGAHNNLPPFVVLNYLIKT